MYCPSPIPLTFEEAASIPLVFLTAWHMLVTNGNIQKGQTVLIHAGGSGVGIAAIQIAKLKGARVITTVGSPEKEKRAKALLGADEVVNYRETDFQQEVMRITNKRGVDLAVDHIGQETFEKSLAQHRQRRQALNLRRHQRKPHPVRSKNSVRKEHHHPRFPHGQKKGPARRDGTTSKPAA
jgi:NADPH:quinone reductase-like Zn-dependent oxidoreductase